MLKEYKELIEEYKELIEEYIDVVEYRVMEKKYYYRFDYLDEIDELFKELFEKEDEEEQEEQEEELTDKEQILLAKAYFVERIKEIYGKENIEDYPPLKGQMTIVITEESQETLESLKEMLEGEEMTIGEMDHYATIYTGDENGGIFSGESESQVFQGGSTYSFFDEGREEVVQYNIQFEKVGWEMVEYESMEYDEMKEKLIRITTIEIC